MDMREWACSFFTIVGTSSSLTFEQFNHCSQKTKPPLLLSLDGINQPAFTTTDCRGSLVISTFGQLEFSWLIRNYGISTLKGYLRIDSVRYTKVVDNLRCREGATPFPGLLQFTLIHIMLSVKQGGIKYHFLSLWYDSARDWTPISRAINEHYPQD